MSGPNKPSCHIIAGPNGSGKTTFARALIRRMGKMEFLNADLIAEGLSTPNPDSAPIAAGRIMLGRINELVSKQLDFALETTLSGKGYVRILKSMKKEGYSIHLHFLWVTDLDVTRNRIAQRVQKGGHDVPDTIIRRRYNKIISNFFSYYRELADTWQLFDNSSDQPRQIAFEENGKQTIIDHELYQTLSQVKP